MKLRNSLFPGSAWLGLTHNRQVLRVGSPSSRRRRPGARENAAAHAVRGHRILGGALVAAVVLGNAAQGGTSGAQPRDGKPYLNAVRSFADTVLKHGRDTYGPQHTPLFVDGLQMETLEPVRWKKGGQTWVMCNFASQQALMRTLDGLTELTKDPHYRRAAEDAARYALQHLHSANGLLYWGGHLAWDLEQEHQVGPYPDVHEMKKHQPYFPLFWRVDAKDARRLAGAIWAGHVLDWSLLDYNRHAKTEAPVEPQWDHPFRENVEVPFPTEASNLSFALVTPSLLDAGTALAVLDKNGQALQWTRRLAYRWVQSRDPKTGLSGGQLSYRQPDRAQETLGHVHPTINEAKIVASYHRVGRYHDIPIAEMQAAEKLIAAGGACARVGKEFIRWASEDLKTYGQYCYDAKSGRFIALMTDGTPIRWQEAKVGYYGPSSFAPAGPDALIFWNYTLAYRLTRDAAHWRMARELAMVLGLGDLGEPATGRRALAFDTAAADWEYIYALLELARATRDRSFLKLACRVGDNLLDQQARTGLFPRPGHVYARTGDPVPLALLHLAAALEGKDARLPQAMLDNGYFHCQFDGAPGPNPNIKDDRTYDSAVFYGKY
jgi:pectate lyase